MNVSKTKANIDWNLLIELIKKIVNKWNRKVVTTKNWN